MKRIQLSETIFLTKIISIAVNTRRIRYDISWQYQPNAIQQPIIFFPPLNMFVLLSISLCSTIPNRSNVAQFVIIYNGTRGIIQCPVDIYMIVFMTSTAVLIVQLNHQQLHRKIKIINHQSIVSCCYNYIRRNYKFYIASSVVSNFIISCCSSHWQDPRQLNQSLLPF